MIAVEKFRPEHLDFLQVQAGQAGELAATSWIERCILASFVSWTAYVGERMLGCSGVVERAPIASMWCFLAEDCGAHMLGLTRIGRRILDAYPYVETTAVADFGPSCRWLELLGFSFARRLPNFGVNGCDHLLYTRGA